MMDRLVEYEEYTETSKSIENIPPNNAPAHEGQAVEAEVEAIEEDSFQNETLAEQTLEDVTSLKCQEVDSLVRHEIKEIIFKQANENITVSVLSEQKNIILEQIKTLQGLKDQIGHEIEQLNIKVEIEKDEMQQLQKRMHYNGEIIEKLQGFMKTNIEEHKRLKNNQQLEEISKQKKRAFEMENWQREIAQLRSAIAAKKASIANGSNLDDLKRKNLLLKSEVMKRRERLEELKQRSREIDERKERVKMISKEEEELKETAKNLKEELEWMKVLKDQKEKEFVDKTAKLNLAIEEKKERLNATLKTAEEMKNTLHECNEEYDRLVGISKAKEEYNTQLDVKKEELLTTFNELRGKYQAKNKKWQDDTQLQTKKLEESEETLTTLIKGNDELNCCLDALKKQYVATLEEKDEKLLLKTELDQKLRSDEVLSEKIKFLNDKMAKKQKAIDELTDKIAALPLDKRLVEMEKNNAYLSSSTDYLLEKYENIKKQVDDVKVEVAKVEETLRQQLVEEKKEIRKNLLKELEELKANPDLVEAPRTPPSILKSPSSSKKFAVSPKKVKFEGVSSYESSGSSEPGASQQSIVGKTFDELFDEIRTGSFKKPSNAAKKRKVDFS